MTVPDVTRSLGCDSISHLSPRVVGRCSGAGCELAYEVDVLGAAAGDSLGDCADCGSPIYVAGVELEDVPHEVCLDCFGAGWDACAAFVAAVVAGQQSDELASGIELALQLGEGHR